MSRSFEGKTIVYFSSERCLDVALFDGFIALKMNLRIWALSGRGNWGHINSDLYIMYISLPKKHIHYS